MNSPAQQAQLQPSLSRFARISQLLMASCLGVMAVAVFINVVLRYGFGSGVAASEELSRLLFVWMVFIGAAAAYPAGEHMAFTSLAGLLAKRPVAYATEHPPQSAAGPVNETRPSRALLTIGLCAKYSINSGMCQACKDRSLARQCRRLACQTTRSTWRQPSSGANEQPSRPSA